MLFDFNAVTSGVVDNLNFIRCSLSQLDADKQMIIAPSAGDFFDVHFKECRFYYAQDSTVPMMKFLANTVNNINFDTFTATKANKNDNGGDYFIYMDRQSGGSVENVSISEGILQQTVSGFSDIRAANNVVFRNLAVYDATVDCSNPMFNFAASTGSVQPDSVTMINVESSFGTTSNPDIKYTTTQTNTYLVMINCAFDKVDLGSGHRFATAVGETPASSSNIVNGHITQLRGQDIRHLTSSGVNDNKEIAFNSAGTIEIDTTLDLTASKLKLNGSSGSDGQVLTTDGSGGVAWETVSSGSGTVNSVGITGTDGIDVDSGSPVTSSGTIALSLNRGIADTNTVKIDHAGVVSGDFARFTANGLEGRSGSQVVDDIGTDDLYVTKWMGNEGSGGSSDVDAAWIPTGTTANRPNASSSDKGLFRFNTTDDVFEGWDGSAWGAVGGGNTTSNGLYEHAHTISANYTIGTNNNAISAGPVSVNSGVSVTVPSGSTWVVA